MNEVLEHKASSSPQTELLGRSMMEDGDTGTSSTSISSASSGAIRKRKMMSSPLAPGSAITICASTPKLDCGPVINGLFTVESRVCFQLSDDFNMADEEEGKEYRWETGYEKTW
ncbi:hypothetical protein ANN_04378 [Periplaneta americana]|uniref:Uncharacterized protein n=1 Tax=Periplaneta americana TaxID=6978 RepID=A0ABQ8TAS7_PERAM|nr:hypothetical protein ANN_04378 [Periplaneta americana]